MPFSLFECQDGTFVVVPRGLAPPLPAYQAHGDSIHLSDLCRHLYDTTVWDDVSREVNRQLYAVVHAEVAFHLFDLPGAADGTVPAREGTLHEGAVPGVDGEQHEARGRARDRSMGNARATHAPLQRPDARAGARSARAHPNRADSQ